MDHSARFSSPSILTQDAFAISGKSSMISTFSDNVEIMDNLKNSFTSSIQQRPDHFGAEFLGDVGVGEDAGGELAFLVLEFVDALFDGVLAEEFVDEDGLVLADAVGAVGGLGLGGGVPPGVVVDDGVGGGEVEPGAAGLEGDEERERILVRLVFLDERGHGVEP